MTPEVENAIAEIKDDFPDHTIDVVAESQGGAYVIVHNLALGDQFEQCGTWVGFLIPFSYPRADVYPHFIDANVKLKDGKSFNCCVSGPTEWQKRNTLQISRKSRRWDPTIDSATTKLAQILDWLRAQ